MPSFPPADEPLALSAPLAWRAAPALCRTDETGESCAWSHGLWQVLRLLDLVTTPVHHAAFFRQAIERLPNSGRAPTVLIAGTADYSMLAQTLAAFGCDGIVPRVTVVDICETPLMLCRWYAARAGVEIRTVRSDILAYEADRPFDFVCTHSMLGRFAPGDRARLARRWASLLRPGGLVATVKRVRPGVSGGRLGFTPAQRVRLVARARERAAASTLPANLGVDEEAFAAAVERYASLNYTWPIADREEIRALFEDAGFAVERLDAAPVGAVGPGLGGPTVPNGAQYVQMVAARR